MSRMLRLRSEGLAAFNRALCASISESCLSMSRKLVKGSFDRGGAPFGVANNKMANIIPTAGALIRAPAICGESLQRENDRPDSEYWQRHCGAARAGAAHCICA